MTEAKNKIQGLIRDSRQAVREFSRRMHLVKAWELLQERDNDGNPKGPLPYTDEAISEFYAAYSCNRDDIVVIHHLAIAHHARAWDRERYMHGHQLRALVLHESEPANRSPH